jgi:hypothetical protein
MEFTLLYDEDMPGLETDFLNLQGKAVVAQFGHEMGKTFAIELAKAFQRAMPTAKAAGPLSGVFVSLHGTDDYNATSNIRSSAVRYHMF